MKRHRNAKHLIIGSAVAVLGITGVCVAVTQASSQDPKASVTKAQTSQKVDPSTPLPVTIETTPDKDTPNTEADQPRTDQTIPTPTVVDDPVAKFKQAVIAKATLIYNSPNSHTSGQSLENFLWAQYWCIYDRATPEAKATVTDAALTERLTFFDPVSTDENGTPHYRYFDGACSVHFNFP